MACLFVKALLYPFESEGKIRVSYPLPLLYWKVHVVLHSQILPFLQEKDNNARRIMQNLNFDTKQNNYNFSKYPNPFTRHPINDQSWKEWSETKQKRPPDREAFSFAFNILI